MEGCHLLDSSHGLKLSRISMKRCGYPLVGQSTWRRNRWSLIGHTGGLTELVGDVESAIFAYEQALRHNQWSIPAMNSISHILRAREKFPEAMEYLRSILKLDPNNGDVWGSLGESSATVGPESILIVSGHCYLMMDNLQEAYTAYQQALYYLRDPKVRESRLFLVAPT